MNAAHIKNVPGRKTDQNDAAWLAQLLEHGRVFAAVTAAGRKAGGARAVDLLIAATAVAADLPLYTRNTGDFAGLDDLLEIVVV